MLVFSEAQMEAFREAAVVRSEQRLLTALADAFPGDFKRLGADGLLTVIRLGVVRAAAYDFDTEQQIYLYLTLMLMLGSFFDEDPQLPWVQARLTATAAMSPLQRIMAVHDTTMAYLDRMAGAENQHLIRALVRVRDFDLQGFERMETASFPFRCISMLAGLFPEKANLQGEAAMQKIYGLARQAALRHGIVSQSGIGLFTGLMFMLGAGFELDPQFPWVAPVLADARQNPAAAIQALHQQALSHLRHGLSGQAGSES